MPDVAVAAVLINAVNDGLDRVDLVRAHHQEFLLAGDQDHIPADHVTECTLGKELVSKVVEVSDLCVIPCRKPVDGKKLLFRIKGKVLSVVVSEVQRVSAVADDEELDEAEQRPGVTVAGVILVLYNLLHCPPGADPECL